MGWVRCLASIVIIEETGRGQTIKKSKEIPEMMLRAVGIVRSEIKEPSLIAKSGDLHSRGVLEDVKRGQDVTSEILIYDNLTGILDGIEDFSHILVIYWAHFTSEADRYLIKVHPMGRKDLPEKGIFATCSPARPNPVCLSVVPLLERNGNLLKVKGLDAVDGSPVIDIKPYNPRYYRVNEAKVAAWMTQRRRGFTEALDKG
ncbi:tRNA (N6-threonylcarbamoyladenosine(37)-N6)-methyltransferase TrmO [Chloroflexota bacterium]